MRKLAFLVAIGATLALLACELGGGRTDVPAQAYVNGMTAAFAKMGGLQGQIQFPSEYAQHSIRFVLDDITFVTHPDGRFRIANVPAGEHTLSVRIKGYEPLQVQVQVRPGEPQALEPLRLKEARAGVQGRLVQEQGRPVEGVRVSLAPDDSVAVTDGNGGFQFLGIGAGEYTLAVRDPRFFASNQHFAVGPQEQRDLGIIRVHRQTRGDPRTARLSP
jgi:hypothetical protein